MNTAHHVSTKIEPFEFQNRTVYRDILRLLKVTRETYDDMKSDLSKKFLGDLFHSLFCISKEIAYSTNHDEKVVQMELLYGILPKIYDCITALEICFEAKWIPSFQYFESKQILEKAYWTLHSELEHVYEELETCKEEIQNKIKHFQ